ncbi:MAG: ADP-ribosylglycohydrolase family protein [Spirochaetaceae bacterium]
MVLGAVAGDVIGSIYEGRPHKTTGIPLVNSRARFTDDTVLTIATAAAILDGRSYGEAYKEFGRAYPHAGYGGSFKEWLRSSSPAPYNSFGNGSAMRVSPVGWAFEAEQEVLDQAAASASCTHNHPEGVKGAQAVALAVWMARRGEAKDSIRREITGRFGYDLDRSVEEIRPGYHFDVTCQGSVPEALRCFLEADGTESAIRLAISLGGDADTQACIAGAVADAFFGPVSREVGEHVRSRVPDHLLRRHDEFRQRYL